MTQNTSQTAGDLVGAFARVLGVAAFRHPVPMGLIILTGAVLIKAGVVAAVITCVLIGGGLVAWVYAHPTSYRRLISDPIRASWRYRRRWAALTEDLGLAPSGWRETRPAIPRLKRVALGDISDVLDVALVPGQTPIDWQKQSDALAHALHAHRVRVVYLRPGAISVTVQRRDALSDPIPMPPLSRSDVRPDLVQVGMTEDWEPWLLPLPGHHVLVGGATGAGKSSLLWSAVRGLAANVRSGSVELWGIDPKGGMTLTPVQHLLAQSVMMPGQPALTLLQQLVTKMNARASSRAGSGAAFIATQEDPAIVLVIDELAVLTAYESNRQIRQGIENALATILTQGRTVGVSVIAVVQDPSKDVVSLRQLFPCRVGLRLTEMTQVDMVLGAGSHSAGALCERIPDHQPGVGYLMTDGTATPLQVRAFHVTLAQARAM